MAEHEEHHEQRDHSIFAEVEEVEQDVVRGLANLRGEFRKGFSDLRDFILTQVVEKLDDILASISPQPAKSISIRFLSQGKGVLNMPLVAPANLTGEHAYIVGNDSPDGKGLSGAPLAPGQTISVVSADPGTVDFTVDATPLKDTEGDQSVWSAEVLLKNPPAQLNVPVDVVATVTNADGTVAETITDTVTVTPPVPGTAKSIGVLFEKDIVSTA